jgi:hypothetical protein
MMSDNPITRQQQPAILLVRKSSLTITHQVHCQMRTPKLGFAHPMPDSEKPPWFPYSVALVAALLVGAIPEFTLPSPVEQAWTPFIGLVHAVAIGASFSTVIVVGAIVYSTRPQGGFRQTSLRRGVFAFLLSAGSEFAFECLDRSLSLGLFVQAGRRELPLLFLAVLMALILFGSRRAH